MHCAYCLKISQKVSIYDWWNFFTWKLKWDIFERFSIFFFSHLIFLLLFWYNIVIAVIFICIVEMMCDKCDNFFFAFLSHTKIQSCFLIFFFEVFFLGYKMKYQWQQQNFDPHRLSTIVSSSSYILSNIFKKPPEFFVWGEEKRKTKVTVFKEGRGNIFL